ncbi:Neuroendocrine convertase 2 [Anabarilius grahami]|uniref:Neuroendocrine convertase 2 n=1 Tax=Anabarilius grahami TaxID=495550 RepID=A0A3N0YDI1_ANAGA|nr:Neuroendocrine convertase 2 [Anabarilius grahami]
MGTNSLATQDMILAEYHLWSLRQNGRPLKRYVEEFHELSHQLKKLRKKSIFLIQPQRKHTWSHQLTPRRFPPHTAPMDQSTSILWCSPEHVNGSLTVLTWPKTIQVLSPAAKMASAPEPRHKMAAAMPEPSVKMAAATPEPSAVMASILVPLGILVDKIQSGNKLVLSITTDACQGKDNFVRYLEHVQAVITVNASRRGDLNINMSSPMGTKSILLSRRPRDDDAKVGFDKWPFMTTHTWGEDPRGTWLLEVGFQGETPQSGLLKEWTVMLHGTQSAPYIDQVVRDYQSKLAMSKKEELEEELDEAVERSLKSLLSKNN